MAQRLTSSTSTVIVSAEQEFCTLMAEQQIRGVAPVDYEASISRAALSAAETPVVRLPDRKACLDCPHFARRYRAVLYRQDAAIFDGLIKTAAADVQAVVGGPPPRILHGVDLGRGPHEPVTPGFEDLARILDPTVLTDALYYNGILPECACSEALFDAADSGFFSGMRLDLLRQSAANKRQEASS